MAQQESTTVFRISDFFTSAMQKIMNSQDKFESKVASMQNKSNNAFGKMKGNLESFKLKNMDAINGIASEIPGADRALALLSNPYVAAGAAAVGAGVAIKKATDYAQQWEAKMAEVNVTAQLSKTELKGLSNELLSIGSRNVAPLEEVPNAFNRIISAGLDVKTSLQALEPTLRAAKAGFTDMETTAAAGVSVMNASGQNINKVYDTLFATLNKGNAKFRDIAQYLPKIIPQARQVGFELGETAGAWAYLTAKGQTAERATTLLENAFKSLANPDRIKALNNMGVAIFDNEGKMLPLVKIVEQLSTKMTGLTDKQRIAKLASLGLDQEASGAFAAMTQNVTDLQKTIDFTTNSTGALNQAYQDAGQSGDKWLIVSNALLKKWEKFGEKFLPLLAKSGDYTLKLIEKIEALWQESTLFRDVITGVGHAFEWMFKVVFWPLKLIYNIVTGIGSVLGWMAEQVGFGTGSFESMYTEVRPYLTWIYERIGLIADIFTKLKSGDFSGAFDAFKNFKPTDITQVLKDNENKKHQFDASVDPFGKQLEQYDFLTGKKIKQLPDNKKSLIPVKDKPAGLDLDGMGKDKKATTRDGSVSGGGTKQTTINIQNLLPGVVVHVNNAKEGAQNIAKMIQEEVLKMLADTSASTANG